MLGDQWTYIDRDELIESGCVEPAANKTLEDKIQAVKTRVIVDAQIPWNEKKSGEMYCLLLPPLEKLLERDVQRTERLGRSLSRTFYAREYVVHPHEILTTMDRNKFDICVDSAELSIAEMVQKILNLR